MTVTISKENQMQTVVGLGGSAGSIRALQVFFSRMPVDSGLAFVVVLHLSPEHESWLLEAGLPFKQIHGLRQRRTVSATRDEATRLGRGKFWSRQLQ